LDKAASTRYLQATGCMCDFLAGLWMHGTCMYVFGSLVIIGMGFFRCDNGFSVAFPFRDSHGVMGLFILVELWIARWFWNWMRWS